MRKKLTLFVFAFHAIRKLLPQIWRVKKLKWQHCSRGGGWGFSEIFFQFVLAKLKTQANMKFDYKAETQLDALTHALSFSSAKDRGNESGKGSRKGRGGGCDLWQVCQLIITCINFIQASFNCPHFYRKLSRVLQRVTAK